VIRCVPGGDPARVSDVAPGSVHIEASNGFFVAGFERTPTAEGADAGSPEVVAGTQIRGEMNGDQPAKKKQKKKKKKAKNTSGD